MDIIFSASLIAAFLAGMVALFAPCCITVLLPAYLASVFREKRDILKMTLVFFAGIAAVLMPIALGAAWLASVFRDFHRELYVVGGLLLIALSYFLYRPIIRLIAERQKKIEEGVRNAEAAARLRSETEGNREQILAGAGREAERILEAGRKSTDLAVADMLADAKTREERLITEAKEKIEEEKRKMMEGSKEEMARMAILAAERILRKQLSK